MIRQNKPSRRVKTTDTVIGIIEAIQKLDGATVTGVADYLDMANSTIYDHLATLEEKRYVIRRSNEYHLSLQFLDHGTYARMQRKIWKPAKLVLERLGGETGEGVRIWTEEHGQTVLLGCEFGEQAIKLPPYDRSGTRGLMHSHAGGKAILAHLPRGQVEGIIERYGLPQQTENTITQSDALFEELNEIRERGYAREDGDVIPQIRSVAAPIVVNGTVHGSISVAAPASRMKGDYFETEVPELVIGAVEEIRLRLIENVELEGEIV